MRRLKRAMELQGEERNKAIELEKEIHETGLKLEQLRGGSREGSGRKRIGVTKKVSITLPHGDWEKVEKARGFISQSEYLRELILKDLLEKDLKRP